MKKITLCLIAFCTLLAFSSAQAQTTNRTKYLNAGIGLGAYTAGGIPIGASFEMQVKDNISVGAFFDYARYGYRYGSYKWHYNFLYFGARGSYHLGELLKDLDLETSKWDPYAGVSLGIRTASYRDNAGSETFTSPYSSGVFLGIHAGSRYLFNEKLGAFAEVGYGVSALRLGITAKF
ncbi:MAG: hypothetical protein ACO1NZ_11555 [Adhaeribacter sp.]